MSLQVLILQNLAAPALYSTMSLADQQTMVQMKPNTLYSFLASENMTTGYSW